MGLCESAKGGIVLESDLSKTRGFHTLAETTAVGCYNAFLDHRRERGYCAVATASLSSRVTGTR
jgi:hypothetical protein